LTIPQYMGNSWGDKQIPPLVSVVVVNYNGLQHIETCLTSILSTRYSNFEVLFVDNGSTDESVTYVENHFPTVRVLKNLTNKGSAGGYNSGILEARGNYVAILNNDVEVDPDWLLPIVQLIEGDQSIGAADAKYLNYYNRRTFDDIAAAGRFLDYFGTVYARGVNRVDLGQYDKPARIFAALTIFRKCIFEQVGLFDEGFFYGYDEVDLSWRINLRGYKIMYVPSSTIYHKASQTSRLGNTLKPRFYFMIKRNRLQMLIKNLPANRLIPALTITLLEYGLYLLYWLTKKNRQYSTELLSSMLWVCRNLKKIWVKRKAVQNIRRVSDRELNRIMVPYQGDLLKMTRKMFKTKP